MNDEQRLRVRQTLIMDGYGVELIDLLIMIWNHPATDWDALRPIASRERITTIIVEAMAKEGL